MTQTAQPYDAEYAFHDSGTVAIRPTGWFPQIAPEGALWPPKPTWRWRAWLFFVECWLRLCCDLDEAFDTRQQRTLWKRHPWMFVGAVWWRPWQGAGGRHLEFIDPSNGLHRMDVVPHDDDFVFDFDWYGTALAMRRWRFPWPR